jgi:hypothetical protein
LKPEWWGSPLAQEEKYQGRKKEPQLIRKPVNPPPDNEKFLVY